MSENPSDFDPYKVLNLNPDATQTQIKSAYRKLALKYHPDRQKTEEDKILYKDKFLEVSRSYELLGDPKLKEQYDKYGIIPNGSGDNIPRRNTRDPFGGFPGGSFMNFAHEQGRFMDPFDLFDRMFHDDFHSNHREEFRSSFQTPFGSPFGSHSGFGGFFDGFGSSMNHHMNMMNDMMNMHQRGSSSFGSNGQGMSTSYYSSSSSSYGRGNGGVQESVSTSTRIINGKRQTVTERVKVLADGTVERSTETSGDDDFPAMLGNEDGGFSSKHRLLQDEISPAEEIFKDDSNNQERNEAPHKKQRFFSRRKNK